MRIHFYLILLYGCCISCKESTKDNSAIQSEPVTQQSIVKEPTANTDGTIDGTLSGCGYNSTPGQKSIQISLPNERELFQIKSILKFSGLNSNFQIYSASIDNAIATIINNQRYILYDPRLLRYTDITSGNYWSSMSILAHEIGHHLSGHTLTSKGSNINDELEADKYSGFVLFKLGASLPQSIAAMQTLGSETDSYSHPSKYKRIEAIKQGWNDGNKQRYESAVPPPPSDDQTWYSDTYFKDEFVVNELLCDEALQNSQVITAIKYTGNKYHEGIIIDVAKLEGYDYFEQNDPEHSLELTIQLTYTNDAYYSVGSRNKFHLINYFNMSNADLSWLESMIIPGRKIRFKTYDYTKGAEDIFYIKKMSRNGPSPVTSMPARQEKLSTVDNKTVSVVSAKAFFHNSPNDYSIRSAYMVYGEKATVLRSQNGFVYVDFINTRGRKSSGWIKISDISLQ